MPDESTGSESTTTQANDPLDITASSIMGDNDQDDADDDSSESESENLADAESESDEDDESEDDESEIDPDSDDDDDEENTPSTLALDPKIAGKLPADVVERYNQQAKGIEKRAAQVADAETKVVGITETWNNIVQWENALASPKDAPTAVKALLDGIAASHNWTREQLAEYVGLSASDSSGQPEWERLGFEFESEYKVYLRAKADAVKESGIDPEILREFKTERERLANEKAFNAHVAEIAPAVIQRLSVKDNGWKVTPEMISEALQILPQFRGEPMKAVRMVHYRSLAKHYAQSGVEAAPRGPERIKSRGTKGVSLPSDPMAVTASMILAGL